MTIFDDNKEDRAGKLRGQELDWHNSFSSESSFVKEQVIKVLGGDAFAVKRGVADILKSYGVSDIEAMETEQIIDSFKNKYKDDIETRFQLSKDMIEGALVCAGVDKQTRDRVVSDAMKASGVGVISTNSRNNFDVSKSNTNPVHGHTSKPIKPK